MRFSAGISIRPRALGADTTNASPVVEFPARRKYSSRTGSRALYFSPVEFFRCLVVPCSMFCETESGFQIAARTGGASRAAFRHAPQTPARISLVPHHSRYKMPFSDFGAAQTRPFAAASSLQPLLPCLQNPWPPVGGRLIANLELEFRINHIRINELKFSNRKFLAISAFPTRSAHRESRATEFLIENARLNFGLSGNDSSHLQISNRERIGVSCSAAPSQSKPPISNLQPARRIRDTCTDIPSPRAFPRCYASCGSRRKSE